jgi:hypothetical protein
LDGLTLVRTRGAITAQLFTATAPGDGFFMGVGICIVTAEAFTVGTTAIPGPLETMDWDGWLYHRMDHMISQDASPAAADKLSNIRYEVDSKAMRKVGVNDVMAMVVETVEIGTATGEIHGVSRILLKLP